MRSLLINAHELQVCVHTTWWNREESKFAFYKGWPSGKDEDPFRELQSMWDMQIKKKKKPCVSVSLFTALTNRSTCSSYLVQYAPSSLNVRLRTQALNPLAYGVVLDATENKGIQMILAIFDIDAHESSDIDDWYNQQIPKLDNLLEEHPGLFIYRSKGGMRILGVLPEPMVLRNHDDADAWTQRYGSWCNYLARKYGLKTEGKDTVDKLADWTRFQRVPHDCRAKDDAPSEFETTGDPEWVGTWEPAIEPQDIPVRAASSHEHRDYSGECQLLQLIHMANLECEQLSPDVYDIHCPDAACHSDSSHRKTKTVLYVNGPIGKIECKSQGCQSKHPDKNISYLACFKTEWVVKTSKSWPFDPLVIKIQDRMDKRAAHIEWDTPTDSPILQKQELDSVFLEKAIVSAALGGKEFLPAFLKEVMLHKVYKKYITLLTV